MNPLDHVCKAEVCDLCGADIASCATTVAEGMQDLLGVQVRIATIICCNCQFVFQLQHFSEALLASLYQNDKSFAFSDAYNEQARIRACLAERQEVISAALAANGVKARASILDVGGGRGDCCAHLAGQHNVVVADPSDAPPVDVRMKKVDGLFSGAIAESYFDVVVMNHVLEHSFSPSKLIGYARHVLADDGVLIAEVPFELFTPLIGRRLGDWRHVAYFCRTTLRQFFEQRGLNVKRLVLEEGCYGVRRLPVIRAVARRSGTVPEPRPIRNSAAVFVTDMLAPAVLWPLLKSRMARA